MGEDIYIYGVGALAFRSFAGVFIPFLVATEFRRP